MDSLIFRTALSSWLCLFIVFQASAQEGIETKPSRLESENVDEDEFTGSPELLPGETEQLIAELTQLSLEQGRTDVAIAWKQFQEDFALESDERKASYVAAKGLAFAISLYKKSELTKARAMLNRVLRIADQLGEQATFLLVAGHAVMGLVEAEFELYESSIRHFNSSVDLANQSKSIEPATIWNIRRARASILRKAKRLNEADAQYLDLIRERESLEIYEADGSHFRYELAEFYVDTGALEKIPALFPSSPEAAERELEQVGPPGLYKREFLKLKIMLAMQQFDKAAVLGEQLLAGTQRYFGKQSVEYYRAAEVFAAIRESQVKDADAIELLQQCIDIRSSILGKDHPSVARLRSEIDRIRKKSIESIESTEPLWKPLDSWNVSAPNRYTDAATVDQTRFEK